MCLFFSLSLQFTHPVNTYMNYINWPIHLCLDFEIYSLYLSCACLRVLRGSMCKFVTADKDKSIKSHSLFVMFCKADKNPSLDTVRSILICNSAVDLTSRRVFCQKAIMFDIIRDVTKQADRHVYDKLAQDMYTSLLINKLILPS